MIAKKDPKLNFEKKRFVFFQVGLITAGTMMLVAFRWSTPVDNQRAEVLEPKVLADPLYEFVAKPEPQKPEPQVERTVRVAIITEEVTPVDRLEDEGVIEPFIDPLDINIGVSNTVPPGDGDIGIETFEFVEKQPEFVGGDEAMMAYFRKSVKYPEIAAQVGDQGRVYVKFLVNKDGSISNVHIERGVTRELDNEALRVVKKMPNWIPGKQRGRPVNVWYIVPINFTLK